MMSSFSHSPWLLASDASSVSNDFCLTKDGSLGDWKDTKLKLSNYLELQHLALLSLKHLSAAKGEAHSGVKTEGKWQYREVTHLGEKRGRERKKEGESTMGIQKIVQISFPCTEHKHQPWNVQHGPKQAQAPDLLRLRQQQRAAAVFG